MDGFSEFYNLTYSTVTFIEHVKTNKPNLVHSLDSWVVYMKKKEIPLVGPKCTPQSCWTLGPRSSKQS
jgi:hypothetical protein